MGEREKGITPEQIKAIKIGAIVLGCLLLIASVFWRITKLNQAAFSEKNVSITIEGETNVDSNQPQKYKITIKNNNSGEPKECQNFL